MYLKSLSILVYFLVKYIFLIPNAAPIIIKKPIPPSTGIHGGGQQAGPPGPVGGVPNWLKTELEISIKKIVVSNKNLFFIIEQIYARFFKN